MVSKIKGANRGLRALTKSSHLPTYPESIKQLYHMRVVLSMWKGYFLWFRSSAVVEELLSFEDPVHWVSPIKPWKV
jgi:hypothetical protein